MWQLAQPMSVKDFFALQRDSVVQVAPRAHAEQRDVFDQVGEEVLVASARRLCRLPQFCSAAPPSGLGKTEVMTPHIVLRAPAI